MEDNTELQDKANIADNTNMYAATSIKKETNLKAKWIGLVVILSLLAISIVAAIVLSVYALVSSNQGMDSLMKENEELKLQLNKTKMDTAKLKEDFTLIATDENMAQLGNLLSSVNALNITDNNFMIEFSNIQSSVNSLNTANEATTTQLNSLQSSVSTLNTANEATTTKLNSLYQSCTQETTSCTLGPITTITYLSSCATQFRLISTAVSLVWAWMYNYNNYAYYI